MLHFGLVCGARRLRGSRVTAAAPAVDIALFKDSVFTSGTLVGGVMFALLMSVTFLLPVFLQEVLGYTATQSGLASCLALSS